MKPRTASPTALSLPVLSAHLKRHPATLSSQHSIMTWPSSRENTETKLRGQCFEALIKPHHEPWLRETGKAHCPNFMFGESSVSRARGQRLIERLGLGLSPGAWPFDRGPAASQIPFCTAPGLFAHNCIYTPSFFPQSHSAASAIISNKPLLYLLRFLYFWDRLETLSWL